LRILTAETSLDENAANILLKEANGDLRVALVMFRADVSCETAEKALRENGFIIEKTIENLPNPLD
jgi:N-acetylmuramic acid 6-phosphate (MurNAc-6-P) etherase